MFVVPQFFNGFLLNRNLFLELKNGVIFVAGGPTELHIEAFALALRLQHVLYALLLLTYDAFKSRKLVRINRR